MKEVTLTKCRERSLTSRWRSEDFQENSREYFTHSLSMKAGSNINFLKFQLHNCSLALTENLWEIKSEELMKIVVDTL